MNERLSGLGQRLKMTRESRDFTIPEVAAVLSLAPELLEQWEQGSLPPLDSFVALCDLFHVSPDTLLGYEDLDVPPQGYPPS